MTNKMILAPKEPTDEMKRAGNECFNDEICAYRATEHYKAMTKDAPTVQEVDLTEFCEWLLSSKGDNNKYGTIYAEVRDGV